MYRGINDFKKGYQPRTNTVKDDNGDVVADCYRILAKWRKYFSQLLNVPGVNDVRQTETHTAEPPVPERLFIVDVLVAIPYRGLSSTQLKRYSLHQVSSVSYVFMVCGLISTWSTEFTHNYT